MKTNQNSVSGLKNRIAQQSDNQQGTGRAPVRVLPAIDYQQREANRALPLDSVLELLRNTKQPSGDLPTLYECAEVVGEWVWIRFEAIPPQPTRTALAQIGFHWNNTRQCWQHPCGQLRTRGQQEPREKYASYFPADRAAA